MASYTSYKKNVSCQIVLQLVLLSFVGEFLAIDIGHLISQGSDSSNIRLLFFN